MMGSQSTLADKIQELRLKNQICPISVTSYISPNILPVSLGLIRQTKFTVLEENYHFYTFLLRL